MINSIEQYLSELKKELSGSDRATIQDALSDAEEYLRNSTGSSTSIDMQAIIEKYGTPAEVAAAYKETELRTAPVYAPPIPKASGTAPAPAVRVSIPDKRNFFMRFIGIYAEPRMWGSLLYLIFSLATGIIYFTWAVTGISVSVSLLVLIVGLPIAGLFLLSVRGIALLEGRLVEALLGVRMPRRPLFSRKDTGWWQKFKGMLASGYTWTALVYMILQLPLGVIYFTVVVTLIGVSLSLITSPIWYAVFNAPFIVVYGGYGYYMAPWATILLVIGGLLLLTGTMHLVKLTGKGHGMLARAMLVRE
ncbi:MAG TPA: sensor domain-containing protein [Dehalococcoidales bacterium]|nr:sensor domain-containing protein [Dehalococcoidales bacterium]